MVALDLEAIVVGATNADVAVANSVKEASRVLARRPSTLRCWISTCWTARPSPVAHLLAERGTPFAFVSGARREDVPLPLRQVPFLPKPYDPQDIERTVPGQAGAPGLRVPAGAGARNLPRLEHPAQGPEGDTDHDAGRIQAGQTGSAPTVWDERARLAALESYSILDTPPERAFDEVVRLAAQICDAPFAVVNLVARGAAILQGGDRARRAGDAARRVDLRPCAAAAGPVRGAGHHAGCALRLQSAGHRRAASALLCGRPAGDGGGAAARHAVRAGPTMPRPEGLTAQQGFALQVLARQVMSQLELRRALKAREADAAAIAESERQFRILADSMPQMVWATQPDGFHDYYNQRWYEFTGMPAGSTDGVAWNGMFHPDDQVRAWARWRHSLATGEPYEIEYRLRRADGDYRWTLGRALPVRDAQGRIIRWFGTCTDIEEQKQAEEQLRISEERLRLALSAAEMVGTWVWDVPGQPDHRGSRLCAAVLRDAGGGGGRPADRDAAAGDPSGGPGGDRGGDQRRLGRRAGRRLRGRVPRGAEGWRHPLGRGARPLRARPGRAADALPRRGGRRDGAPPGGGGEGAAGAGALAPHQEHLHRGRRHGLALGDECLGRGAELRRRAAAAAERTGGGA